MNKIIAILICACLVGLVIDINKRSENAEALRMMSDKKDLKNQEAVRKMEKLLGNNDTSSDSYHKALKVWTGSKNMTTKLQAMHLFMKAVDGGHPNAQFIMAQLYMNGEYLLPNYSESVELLEQAGKQGLSLADIQLGVMYSMGTGISKDSDKGMQFLGRAASNDANYASQIFDPVVEFVKTGKMDEKIFEEFLFKTMDYSEKNYKNAWYKEHVNVVPTSVQ